MRESAALGPCGGSNGDQQGIDLQTAQQHGTGKNQLGERGEGGIIAAGGDDAKARADIIKAAERLVVRPKGSQQMSRKMTAIQTIYRVK